jgi:hypothetical protein
MTMKPKQAAIAVTISASALLGGLGLTHAMAATKSTPSPSRSKGTTTKTQNCPNDKSGTNSSTNA